MVAQTFDPNGIPSWEAEAGQSDLYSKLQDTQSYPVRPCLNKNRKKKGKEKERG